MRSALYRADRPNLFQKGNLMKVLYSENLNLKRVVLSIMKAEVTCRLL